MMHSNLMTLRALYVILLFFCIVLPVILLWLVMRAKINKDNAQKEIMMSALEKNPQINIESLAKNLESGRGAIRERMLNKLTWGCILSFVGITGIIVVATSIILRYKDLGYVKEKLYIDLFVVVVITAVGIAFIVNFLASRKLLADEIEAEKMKESQK